MESHMKMTATATGVVDPTQAQAQAQAQAQINVPQSSFELMKPSVAAVDTSATTATTTPNANQPMTNKKKKIEEKATILSKKLAKRIASCGKKWERALDILHEVHPQLKLDPHILYQTFMEQDDDNDEYEPMDTRAICSVINVLGRADKPDLALKLIEKTLIVYHSKLNSRSNSNQEGVLLSSTGVFMILKYGISMIGQTCNSSLVLVNPSDPSMIVTLLLEWAPYHTGQEPPLDMYHAAVGALGKCKRMDLILTLLDDMQNSRVIPILHHHNNQHQHQQGDAAADTIENPNHQNFDLVLPKPDVMTYQTALTSSIRCKACDEAVSILRKMKQIGIDPDVYSYNKVLSSLTSSGHASKNARHLVAMELLEEMEADPNITPIEATYKSVISICGKENAWDLVSKVMTRMNGDQDSIVASGNDGSSNEYLAIASKRFSSYIKDLEQLEKVSKGRGSWYKLGCYQSSRKDQPSIEFGIQTHVNPVKNGLSVVFHAQETGIKLGYMLIRNTALEDEKGDFILNSSLLGMYIDETQRGKGLASICMAIWLQLCLCAKAQPRTEKINKPLLSLVLCKFGFLPEEGGLKVEISPLSSIKEKPPSYPSGWVPKLAMYSKDLKPLDGSFGKRELRTQQMMITREPPCPRGTVTTVKTSFDHPISAYSTTSTISRAQIDLESNIKRVLHGSLKSDTSDDDLRRVLFGFCIDPKRASNDGLNEKKKSSYLVKSTSGETYKKRRRIK